MAAPVTIKVLGDKAVSAGLKGAGKAFRKERKKAMRAILRQVVVPAVKRQVRAQFKGGKRFRKMALPQAELVTLPGSLDVMGEVFPRVGFMGVFETGGVVSPNTAKKSTGGGPRTYFKIPIKGSREGLAGGDERDRGAQSSSLGAKTFIRRSKRGNLIIFRRNFRDDITPLFVLKKHIRLPRRPFLGPAADSSASAVAERLGNAYVAAVGRGF